MLSKAKGRSELPALPPPKNKSMPPNSKAINTITAAMMASNRPQLRPPLFFEELAGAAEAVVVEEEDETCTAGVEALNEASADCADGLMVTPEPHLAPVCPGVRLTA